MRSLLYRSVDTRVGIFEDNYIKMSFELKEIIEKSLWDDFVENHHYGHLLQSWNWGEFKKPVWEPLRYGLYQETKLIGAAQILKRPIFGRRSFFYIPRGPVLDPANTSAFSYLVAQLEVLARRNSVFAICFETNFTTEYGTSLFDKKFQNGMEIQPNDTSLINLNPTKEELLAHMHPKTRQNIRKTQRSGTVFFESKNIAEFLKVVASIRRRAKILMYPDSYYQKFWEIFNNEGKTYLFFVKVNGEIDAGSLAVGYGQTLYALYGGPINQFPHVQSSLVLKWETLKKARELGYDFYDQMGLAPQTNQSHNYAGVTTFKERFGGQRRTYTGAKYLVVDPFWYHIYKAGPAVRAPFVRLLKVLRK